MSNVINQMTTNVNLLKGMNMNSVVDIVHDEVVIDVSETMTKEEAIEEIKRWTPILLNSGQCTEKTSEAQDMAISALSKNKRNTAEWEIDGHHLKCPICGEYFCRTDAEQCAIPCNFCPNCGADMRGK